MRLAIAVMIVFGAFAGCGGDDDTADSPPTKGTTAVQGTTSGTTTTTGAGSARKPRRPAAKDPRVPVEAVLTSSDPADACGRYVTEHYLQAAYGGRQGCVQAQAPGSAARSLRDVRVAINDVVHNGNQTADVTAIPVGGPYDGEKVKVLLVGHVGPSQREFLRGGWRIFELQANVPVGP